MYLGVSVSLSWRLQASVLLRDLCGQCVSECCVRPCVLADRVIALESWEGLGPQEAFKKDSQGLSWVGAGNPGFP